jgi:hypothetical protein
VNKRKIQVLLLAAVLLFVPLVLLLRTTGEPATDEAKYLEWHRTSQLPLKISQLASRLPKPIANFLPLRSLAATYWRKHTALDASLLASGYLTNITVTSTQQTPQLISCLTNTFRPADKAWIQINFLTNAIITITIRSQYAPTLKRALENN